MNRRSFIRSAASGLLVPAVSGIVRAQDYLSHRRKAFQDYRVGLAAEWDGNSVSGADLSPVGLWSDLVAGADGTQSTVFRQPRLRLAQLNGHSAIDFDGGDGLNTTFTGALGDFTGFVVYRATGTSAGNYDRILDKAYDTGFWVGRPLGGNWGVSVRNTTPPSYMSAQVVGPTTGVWYVLSFRRSGTVLTIRYNGTLHTASASVSASALSNAAMVIGNESLYTNGFFGMIAAIRLYATALTDDVTSFLERRFGAKYAISIIP